MGTAPCTALQAPEVVGRPRSAAQRRRAPPPSPACRHPHPTPTPRQVHCVAAAVRLPRHHAALCGRPARHAAGGARPARPGAALEAVPGRLGVSPSQPCCTHTDDNSGCMCVTLCCTCTVLEATVYLADWGWVGEATNTPTCWCARPRLSTLDMPCAPRGGKPRPPPSPRHLVSSAHHPRPLLLPTCRVHLLRGLLPHPPSASPCSPPPPAPPWWAGSGTTPPRSGVRLLLRGASRCLACRSSASCSSSAWSCRCVRVPVGMHGPG